VGAFQPGRISEYLHDLQAYFTAASRVGRKGFGWFGWSASQWSAVTAKTRRQSPASGAHLSMMTTECARKLLPLWLKERGTHMGAFFAAKLRLEWQSYLGSFYVWPPVGGYWTHISTTCSSREKPRLLEDHFDHKWSQEGTRKKNSPQVDRWICEFTERGSASFLMRNAVKLPEDLAELYWRTDPLLGTREWACGWRYYHLGVAPSNKPETEDRLLERLVFVV